MSGKKLGATRGNGRMTEVINNEEKFAKFVEIRELRLAGKTEEANALRAELGLGLGQGKDGNMKREGQGNHDGQRRGMGRNAERG